MEQRKAKCSRYGMFTGILYIGILGLVFGAVVHGVPAPIDIGDAALPDDEAEDAA